MKTKSLVILILIEVLIAPAVILSIGGFTADALTSALLSAVIGFGLVSTYVIAKRNTALSRRAEHYRNKHAELISHTQVLRAQLHDAKIDNALSLGYKNAHEMQSGFDRLDFAENLIRELPKSHGGANTWLLNYGIGKCDTITRNQRKALLNAMAQGYQSYYNCRHAKDVSKLSDEQLLTELNLALDWSVDNGSAELTLRRQLQAEAE